MSPRPEATHVGTLADASLLAELDAEPITAVGPAPRRPSPAGDEPAPSGGYGWAKAGGGAAGAGAILVALDALLKDPAGGGVPQVLAHLGPVLGVLYANAPVALTVMGLGWFLLREYRREQTRHRRQDRRAQAMLARLAREQAATTQAVNGVRHDVQALRADVDNRFEGIAAEAASLRSALAGAEGRLDEHGEQIREVRQRVDRLEASRAPASAHSPTTARRRRSSGG